MSSSRGRAVAAVAIVVAWVAGLGMLVRREYYSPHLERLSEAAMRVTPAAVFYAVMLGDRQVGFASSTVDTSSSVIEQREYLVADVPVGGSYHRAEARTTVTLSRALRVKSFEAALDADQGPVRASGLVLNDTLVQVALSVGQDAKPDTQLIRVAGPILLPTLVPLAIALEEKPKVGKTYVLPVFDPTTLAPRDVRIEVRAESLFVVNDSSVYDSTSGRWYGALPDTIRAWQIESQGGAGIGGWVDEQGQLVASTQLGFRLVRLPYEVAFENWQKDVAARPARAVVPSRNDLYETTAIAANRRLKGSLATLRVRVWGDALTGGRFTLSGGRQELHGDTLTVKREQPADLEARYAPVQGNRDARADLRAEPFLEVEHPEIIALAARLADNSRDARLVAQRINDWVHDSLRKEVSIGIPSALNVLHTRAGDCNEHTQLFVALARAAGIPARIAAGLAYVDGKFYYHAWPEILLRRWVAVDPTFGQFPADAAHLRFVTGGLLQQAELLRLVNGLHLQVVGNR